MKTTEQERMKAAWNALMARFPIDTDYETWNIEQKETAKRYLTAVKKTATRIHGSGLGQALAFLQAHSKRGTPMEGAFYDISKLTLDRVGEQGSDLLGNIRSWHMSRLFYATDEAMAACGWLSRYLSGVGVTVVEIEE